MSSPSPERLQHSANQLPVPDRFWGQRGELIFNDPPAAVYVHVPFCRHRCGYCNFTLITGREDLVPAYLRAVETQMDEALADYGERDGGTRDDGTRVPVQTIYFGGGTPSQLPLRALEQLLTSVANRFSLASGGEWTVEVNPADVTPALLDLLAAHHVTRISLGIQSFQHAKLQLLERDHDPEQAWESCQEIAARFPHVSVDLIFATPGETLESWQAELDRVGQLAVDHISTYGLTWEQGTQFWNRRRKGELLHLSDELECELYLRTLAELPRRGWQHYEVSSFAREAGRSRHNQTYWRGESYWGFGPGAAQYVLGQRSVNHRSTTTWLKRRAQGQPAWESTEVLTAEQRARELLVFSLRQIDGVDRHEFAERTGWDLAELGGQALAEYCEAGWLRLNDSRCELTRAGLVISDGLWGRLLV